MRELRQTLGIESGGQTEVKRGLQLGQRVVVSSQFLIDSEASLKGVESRLNVELPPTAANAAPRHTGTAKIEAIGRDTMTLSHGPIASLKWPAMTMDFKFPKGGAPRGVDVGDRVDFEFFMPQEGPPQLTRVTLLPPEPKAPMAPASAGSKP